jgi:ATP-dependent Clp protease ATP-binding subunit ClpC
MSTLANDIKAYAPAITLTKVINRRVMSVLRSFFFVFSVLGIIASLAMTWFDIPFSQVVIGITLIFIALWVEQVMVYAYHNSFYFRGLNSLLGLKDKVLRGATYDVAEAVIRKQEDVTFAFCTSTFGNNALLRSAVPTEKMDQFLAQPRPKITADMVILPEDEIFSVIGLGKYLMAHDKAFAQLLKENGVGEATVLGALRWVVGNYHQEKRRQRWWSKDNLSKTTGIGREWAYGVAYTLERFSRNISTSSVFSTLTTDSPFAEQKINEIETALARAKAANVMVLGEPGVGKIDLVMKVQERMANGKSIDSIANQHMVVLDTNRLFASHKDKQSLEQTLLRMFDETARAGNTIVVIENISTFIREAEALGVFLPELLDEYLASPLIRFIVTETPGEYHARLEPMGSFTRRFAEVLIDSPDLSATTKVLESIALTNETRYNVLFTYPALTTITSAADRYVVEGVMPEKAIELLIEVATRATQQGKAVIDETFVYEVVSEKTGVPAGPIQDDERDLLLHLADRLRQQVVGQKRALDAIARTMRRARAGIQAADKPIGSFLFLGPTGVGKTETAKALANIFFGGEHNLRRLDMSEFSGPDGLDRLIGDGEQSGVLADMLREHPYCVLLLDEFEKAARPVHDLFLQILDEGNFTDARGNKVNARNSIIIATSNAGSQLIINTVQQRKELSHLTQEIINSIIRDGVFRPELINRFDNTIVFEPLSIDEQSQVASFMLGDLYNRIKERGYELEVHKELMDLLVQKGYSPEFGARPMKRVLQDIIEEKVAQKIISGRAEKGDTISLALADFTADELAVSNS